MDEQPILKRSFPIWPFAVVPYFLTAFVDTRGEETAGYFIIGFLLVSPPLVGLIAAIGAFIRKQRVWPGLLTFGITSFLLVGSVLPDAIYVNRRQSIAQVEADQRHLASALDQYAEKHGQYPASIDKLQQPCVDPFADGLNYAYWTDSTHWLLRSIGPDHYDDLPASWIESASDEPAERWKQWLEPYQYEPTNGMKSSGDIIRTGP